MEEHEHLRAMLHLEAVDLSDLAKAGVLLASLQQVWETLKGLDDHLPDWSSRSLVDPVTGQVVQAHTHMPLPARLLCFLQIRRL